MTYFVDPRRTIEIDAVYQYRLPTRIVIRCFEKLIELTIPSYDLYEQFAYSLLLHGNEHNELAEAYWYKAQTVRNQYEWKETTIKKFGTAQYVIPVAKALRKTPASNSS